MIIKTLNISSHINFVLIIFLRFSSFKSEHMKELSHVKWMLSVKLTHTQCVWVTAHKNAADRRYRPRE